MNAFADKVETLMVNELKDNVGYATQPPSKQACQRNMLQELVRVFFSFSDFIEKKKKTLNKYITMYNHGNHGNHV